MTGDKCGNCIYWNNEDDPDESCSDNWGANPEDKACGAFCGKETE